MSAIQPVDTPAGTYAPPTDRRDDGSDLVSYRTLRRVVGLLGVALPVVLAAYGFAVCGWWHFQPTISDYYALPARDVFVGVLFTIGWFLFTYHGFDWRDNLAGNIANVFALGVALFPDAGWSAKVHYIAAAGLFLTLAVFSLFLFTRSRGGRTARKILRNRIYVACGVVILASVAAIGAFHSALIGASIAGIPAVFALETLALWAFGFSWFVKGETIFRDRR
jgi:hypothetical protein